METLRVPKRRTPVEIVLPDGSSRRVAVFLAEQSEPHPGPERLSDLLDAPGEFLPALDEASGAVVFLNRANIVVVRAEASLEPDIGAELTLPTEHEVEVALAGGLVLRGLLSYVLPPERSRLGDYLNEPTPFLRLLERDRIALVNKRHVVRVAPAGA